MDKKKIIIITGAICIIILILVIVVSGFNKRNEPAIAPTTQSQTERNEISAPTTAYNITPNEDNKGFYYLTIDDVAQKAYYYDTASGTQKELLDLSDYKIPKDNILNALWSPNGSSFILEVVYDSQAFNKNNPLYNPDLSDGDTGQYIINTGQKKTVALDKNISSASHNSSGLGKLWLDDDRLLYFYVNEEKNKKTLSLLSTVTNSWEEVCGLNLVGDEEIVLYNERSGTLYYAVPSFEGPSELYKTIVKNKPASASLVVGLSGFLQSPNRTKLALAKKIAAGQYEYEIIAADTLKAEKVTLSSSPNELTLTENGDLLLVSQTEEGVVIKRAKDLKVLAETINVKDYIVSVFVFQKKLAAVDESGGVYLVKIKE